MAKVLRKEFPQGTYLGQRGAGYSMDGILKENLDFIKQKVLTKKIDYVFCIDGRVGVGKSTLALQIARYLDEDFNLSKVTFTPKEFMEAIKKGKKGDCIILDEAIVVGSRYAMSEWNKRIMMLMSQVRSKQMFIFFILPSVFDLDRNLSLYRTNMLLHCYTQQLGSRGYYSVYFESEVKSLYLNGKKYYSYSNPKPNHFGKFSKCFVLDENVYEIKKQKAIESLGIEKSPKDNKFKRGRDNLIKFLVEKLNYKYKEVAEVVKEIKKSEIGMICRGER